MMTGIPADRSPLACLMLFLIQLALAGSILAAVHYAAVDRPQQKAVQAPENRVGPRNCRVSCTQQACGSTSMDAEPCYTPEWDACMKTCNAAGL